MFRHKGGCTLYLIPESPGLLELQAAAAAVFPECAGQGRSFTPHLSVGQYRSKAAAEDSAQVTPKQPLCDPFAVVWM